jgi:protein-L-isoaspartate(D-aspartate) O-methyltransferase
MLSGFSRWWANKQLGLVTIYLIFIAAIAGASSCATLESKKLTPRSDQKNSAEESHLFPQEAVDEHSELMEITRTSVKIPHAEFTNEREALVKHAVAAQNLENEDVIRALGVVPRHCFVPEDLVDKAYYDTALPIGYGQTISQPSLVASMTELLALEPGDKVLEIGTGSGYQAAILAELGYVEVYSIEIVPELHERAQQLLLELDYEDVTTKQGDGYYGWSEYAPFDAIIVTAAPDHLPGPLAEQLAEGGVMVIPIGPQGWYQTLWKFMKVDGELTAYNQGPVSFVPFTGPGIGESTPLP